MKILLKLFLLPGVIFAWVEYMFPKSGDVWASGRRVDSKGVHVLYALLAWAIGGYLVMHQYYPSRLDWVSKQLNRSSTPSVERSLEEKAEAHSENEVKPRPESLTTEDVTENAVTIQRSDDWPSIHEALNAAYQLGAEVQRMNWSNPSNEHSGSVTQSGIGEDENGCRQYRIQLESKQIVHLEYCADDSIH